MESAIDETKDLPGILIEASLSGPKLELRTPSEVLELFLLGVVLGFTALSFFCCPLLNVGVLCLGLKPVDTGGFTFEGAEGGSKSETVDGGPEGSFQLP
jgi:hypothetical protein